MSTVIAREQLTALKCVRLTGSINDTKVHVRVKTNVYKSMQRRIFNGWDDSKKNNTRVVISALPNKHLSIGLNDELTVNVPKPDDAKQHASAAFRIKAFQMLVDKYSSIAHRAVATVDW